MKDISSVITIDNIRVNFFIFGEQAFVDQSFVWKCFITINRKYYAIENYLWNDGTCTGLIFTGSILKNTEIFRIEGTILSIKNCLTIINNQSLM